MKRKGCGGRELARVEGKQAGSEDAGNLFASSRDHRGTFVTGAERGKEVYFKLFCTHWRRGTFWKATIT